MRRFVALVLTTVALTCARTGAAGTAFLAGGHQAAAATTATPTGTTTTDHRAA
jgi:hypothetical protein